MQQSELLFSIAEVAVAFAGFASIVGALGRRYSRDDPRLDSFRLRTMLSASLLGVGGGRRHPVSPRRLWIVSTTGLPLLTGRAISYLARGGPVFLPRGNFSPDCEGVTA